jgi:hypothetical protein
MGEMRNSYRLWSENVKGKDQAEDLGVDERIILKWSYRNRVGKCGLNSYGSG